MGAGETVHRTNSRPPLAWFLTLLVLRAGALLAVRTGVGAAGRTLRGLAQHRPRCEAPGSRALTRLSRLQPGTPAFPLPQEESPAQPA